MRNLPGRAVRPALMVTLLAALPMAAAQEAALTSPDMATRLHAVASLGSGAPLSPAQVRILSAALKDPDDTVRGQAALNFSQHGRESVGAIAALAGAVGAAPDRRCPRAAAALAFIGGPAIPALLALLESPDPAVRRAALDRLLEAFDDDDGRVRRSVAAAIAQARAVTPSVDERGLWTREISTSGELAREPGRGRILRAALDHRQPSVRAAAAHLLPAFPAEVRAALPRLIELLADPDSSVRTAAAEALESIGSGARAAVRPLLALLAVHGRDTAIQAALTLDAIGGPARARMVRMVLGQLNAIDDDTRGRARRIAYSLGPGLLDDLIRALADDRSPRGVRLAALDLVDTMTGGGQALPPDPSPLDLRPGLRALAHDDDPGVRLAALKLLARVDPDSVERDLAQIRSGVEPGEDDP